MFLFDHLLARQINKRVCSCNVPARVGNDDAPCNNNVAPRRFIVADVCDVAACQRCFAAHDCHNVATVRSIAAYSRFFDAHDRNNTAHGDKIVARRRINLVIECRSLRCGCKSFIRSRINLPIESRQRA